MTASATVAASVRRFAWDGFSMELPDDWDLAFYQFDKHRARVRLEDSEAVRLEFEWTRPRRPVDAARLPERYRKMAGGLEDHAVETRTLEDLPVGWQAFLHRMADKRLLVTGYWLAADRRFFGMLKLHLDHVGRRAAARVLRRLAESFTLADGPDCEWEFYDMSFRLDRRFKLASTALEAGRKRLVFQRRLDRLFLWQFSLADRLLGDRAPAAWAAEFLNGYKELRGVRFAAESDTRVVGRRLLRYPLGHYDQLGRMCYRYHVDCVRYPEINALALAVYNYRRQSDLEVIASLRTSLKAG